MKTSLFVAVILAVLLMGCGSTPSLPAIHVVESGDTLSEISQEYYGTMLYWERIAEENEIDDPKALEIGAELVIPKL